jgi:hypothetical protein
VNAKKKEEEEECQDLRQFGDLASAPNGVRCGAGPGLAQAFQRRSDQGDAALAEELANGTSHVAQPAQLLRPPLQLGLLNRRERQGNSR